MYFYADFDGIILQNHYASNFYPWDFFWLCGVSIYLRNLLLKIGPNRLLIL
jgi:hypothetical protein